MANFLYDSYLILNKIYSEKTYIKQAISSINCEPKNKPLTVKIVYGVVENDLFLETLISQNTQKAPKQAIKIILKQALYLIKFSNKPIYAVTNEAVDLAKKLGKGGVSGFINAFLRKSSKIELVYPKDNLAALSIKYSYPLSALKLIVENYGLDLAEKIISFKSDIQTIRIAKGKSLDSSPDFTASVFENVFFTTKMTMDEAFFSGVYTFQSIGSVAIANIVEPCNKLLDACAAPGGKSVYLAEKCQNVTAFEVHPHRLELIKSYADRMNIQNITPILKDSTVFDESYVEKFDAVLCDVPCSSLGVAHENPDIKMNFDIKAISSLNKLQYDILSTCSNYVKRGGYLYYSTCSVLKLENDDVVLKFLENFKDFELELPHSPLENISTKSGLQFLPHLSNGAGFFVTKFRKKL